MDIKDFTPRGYQLDILKTCKENNTLVCLPTGTGKTKLAILVAISRLNDFPNSKVLFLTPTKPLTTQIFNEFIHHTTIDKNKIALLTGAVSQKKRSDIYENNEIIIATPQTIESDLESKRTYLSDFSLLVVDECHRSRENFANTKVAKYYFDNSKNQRVIALTASPGSSKERINEICNNLFLKKIEIRTDSDESIKEHIQDKNIEYVHVEFPEEFKAVHSLIKQEYKSRLEGVKSFGVYKPTNIINKVDLITLQKRLFLEIKKKNHSAYNGISLTAQLLKLSYCLELIETQSLNSLKDFFKKLETDESKAAKSILSSENIKKAIILTNELVAKELKHPKMIKLCHILADEISKDKNYRAIVFANYRNTISHILTNLEKIHIKAKKFVGQADREDKGLNQKEQIETINDFKSGLFNILVASSVAEEGIDIPEVNAVIFYEPIGSELWKIQRAGRTGRTKPGKIIFLITKDTRDVGLHYASLRKEKKMKSTLIKMREDNIFSKFENG